MEILDAPGRYHKLTTVELIHRELQEMHRVTPLESKRALEIMSGQR